jgi:hypothetical protein
MVIGGVHLIAPFYFLNDHLKVLAGEINVGEKEAESDGEDGKSSLLF